MEYKKEPYESWTNSENNMTYLFYKTKDDSISVSLKSDSLSTELMHSVDGAFSETIHLYEDVVKYVFSQNLQQQPTFLSLGLGMGYVEILVCAYVLKNHPNQPFKIFSFEKENDLRTFFKKFIFGEEIPRVFQESYHQIINMFCSYYGISYDELKGGIKNRIENNSIELFGEYNLHIQLEKLINGLFFDAFSFNTSPELWADELIEKILRSCAPKAAFATYASRSHLKKLLLGHGFTLEKKKGYGGKKESTFAYR